MLSGRYLDPRSNGTSRYASLVLRYRLFLVFLYLALAALAGPLALSTHVGQAVDTLVMYSLGSHLPFDAFFQSLLGQMMSIPALAVVAAIILVSVFVRRRFALLFRVLAVLVGANGLTQLMKSWITRPYLGVVEYAMPNSFPSGHVTLASSVAIVLIAVVPVSWKRFTTLVVWILVSVVGVAVMALGWHRLSDVLVALLITGIFGLLALPAEWSPSRGSTPRWFPSVFATLVFAVSAAGIAVVALPFRDALTAFLASSELVNLAQAVNPGLLVAGFGALATAGISASVMLSIDLLSGN